ncbi:MAG: stalk domain-containing protein [Candidatus Velthaea sp.]
MAGCTLAFALPLHAAAAPPRAANAKPKPAAEIPARIIAIAINGEELARDPAPRFVGNRLLVPVVRIYNALGIAVSRDRNNIVAAAPAKTITLHIGSNLATIDNRTIAMETPATEIGGATYVPLRFVADSLGAVVTYDSRAARVDVVSSLVGRTPSLMQSTGGATQVVGTVSALDLNSAPESITVTRSGSARTISINSDAKIVIQDVVTKTNAGGTLGDVHVGDAVSVYLAKDGRVQQLVDRFASRAGTIAAVSSSAVVLQSGFVVAPDRATDVSLNGTPATMGDLRVGDTLVVRSNPDTGEKRQIIVSRAVPPTPQASSGATTAINTFSVAVKGPMRAGDAFDVTLKGTPGGRATFDIGTYVTGVAMREDGPGTYIARYTIPPGVNFGQTPVYGHLSANGADAPRAQAPSLVAVSTTPPTINDFAPPSGQTVNNAKPSIFATFSSPTDVGINPSAVTINVNGLDVTASATRTATFITYSPSVAFADGQVNVKVTVTDNAGNKSDRQWSFTVRTR